jgi:hypothetical protein
VVAINSGLTVPSYQLTRVKPYFITKTNILVKNFKGKNPFSLIFVKNYKVYPEKTHGT